MNRVVVAVVEDLIFKSKIRATAEAVDVEVRFPRTLEGALSDARALMPEIVIVDLQNRTVDPFELARQLKADEELREIQLLGFLSHVEVKLRNEALKAGFDRVVPRSEFSRDLVKTLTS